jgi:Flp pilus assembly protein TadD
MPNASQQGRACRECNYPVDVPCNMAECRGFDTARRSPFDMYYPKSQQPVQQHGTVSAPELRHPLSKSGEKALVSVRAKFDSGHRAEALAALQKAQKDSSSEPYALSLMGELRLRSGDLPGAVAALRQAIPMLPIAANYANLGYALCLLNRCEEGRAEIERSIQLDHNSPKTRFLLGVMLLDAGGKESEAKAQLELIQEQIPAARLALAVVHERTGEPDAARDQLRLLTGPDAATLDAMQVWAKAVAANKKPSEAFNLGSRSDQDAQ